MKVPQLHVAAKESHLTPEDCLFQLADPASTWIVALTCRTEGCQCRTTLILSCESSKNDLLEQSAAIREAWLPDSSYVKMAESYPNLNPFLIDIDACKAMTITNEELLDLATNSRITNIIKHVDGEILEAFAQLWLRGKGLPNPETRALNTAKINVTDWRRDAMIGWEQSTLAARQDLYILGNRLYLAIEKYCPIQNCGCGEVHVQCIALHSGGTDLLGQVFITKLGEITVVPELDAYQEKLEQFWTAFQQRHANFLARFSRRYLTINSISERLVPIQGKSDTSPKIGRNDPCPCGSGKKHKKCCGAN